MIHGSSPSMEEFVKGLLLPGKHKADNKSNVITNRTEHICIHQTQVVRHHKANKTHYNQSCLSTLDVARQIPNSKVQVWFISRKRLQADQRAVQQ